MYYTNIVIYGILYTFYYNTSQKEVLGAFSHNRSANLIGVSLHFMLNSSSYLISLLIPYMHT